MSNMDDHPGLVVTGAAGAGKPQPLSGTGAVLGGRYQLGMPIGQGGMASVYQAHDKVLGREVALKLFRTGAIGQDETKRQEAEARVLASLNHRNLVTVFDVGTDTGTSHPQTFLVMELIRGEDLHRARRHAPLNGEEVLAMGAGVADALAYIHGRSIVHRDVKPANILLGDRDNPHRAEKPKLTDFGIARLMDSARLTTTGESIGTATYFSPEQAQGTEITTTSDIYSLGLVLLECLSGDTTFPGPAAASAAARVHRDPQIPASLDPGWINLLTAMTAREPSNRPTAADTASALRALPAPATTVHRESTAGPTQPTSTSARDKTTGNFHAVGGSNGEQPTSPIAATALETSKSPSYSTPTDERNGQPATVSPSFMTRSTPELYLPEENDDEPARLDPETTPEPPGRRRRLRPVHWVLTALAVVFAALVLVSVLMATLDTGADTVPVDYPAVPGELGGLLEELQESVEP